MYFFCLNLFTRVKTFNIFFYLRSVLKLDEKLVFKKLNFKIIFSYYCLKPIAFNHILLQCLFINHFFSNFILLNYKNEIEII